MLFCKIFLSIYFCISFTSGCNYIDDEEILFKRFSSSNTFFNSLNKLLIHNTVKFTNDKEAYEKQYATYLSEYNKDRIKYGFGLSMCNTFATHIQCSQAITAYRFAKSMMDKVESIKGKKEPSETVSSVKNAAIMYYYNVLELMDIIYVLGYVPPRHMVLSSLYAKEVQEKALLECSMELFIDESLNELGNVVKETSYDFINQCRGILGEDVVNQISNEAIINILELTNNYLSIIRKELAKTRDVLVRNKDSKHFDTKKWLLNDLFMNNESLEIFFCTKATYLNIDWNELQTKLINTFTPTQKSDWRWNMYNNSVKEDSHQNKIKQVYRTVVNRQIFIGVLDCHYLSLKVTLTEFTATCSKIETIINDAISFLQEDLFLTELLPYVKMFIQKGNFHTWDVFNILTSELNSLSTILEVEANNSYAPQEVLTNNYYKEIEGHLDAAINYTKTIKNSFTDQFFDVIDVIQSSVNNEKMMLIRIIEKERTGLLMPEKEENPAEPVKASVRSGLSGGVLKVMTLGYY